MEIGLGLLGWPPDVFWKATFPEILAAAKGYPRRFGMSPTPPIKKADVLKRFEEIENG